MAGVDEEVGGRDRLYEPVLCVASDEGIGVTPDEEGRGFDARKLVGVVVA